MCYASLTIPTFIFKNLLRNPPFVEREYKHSPDPCLPPLLFQVPVLDFMSGDPRLLSGSDRPFLLSTSPSEELELTALCDLISFYQWRQVVFVFANDRGSVSSMQLLHHLLDSSSGVPTKVAAKLSIDANSTDDAVIAALTTVGNLSASVFIVHASSGLPAKLFRAARGLGWMGKGYAWIATSTTVKGLSLDPASANQMALLAGVVTVSPLVSPSAAFKQAWDAFIRPACPGYTPLQPDAASLFAHDAAVAIARGLDALLRSPNDTLSMEPYFSDTEDRGPLSGGPLAALSQSINGSDILTSILSANFTGESGQVWFGQNGGRNPMRFQLQYFAQNRSAVGFGIWDPSLRPRALLSDSMTPLNSSYLLQEEPVNVVWPYGGLEPPIGWFPKREITVAVPDKQGFNEFVKIFAEGEAGHTGNDRFTGFCIDVFRSALQFLPYNVQYRFVEIEGPSSTQNPSYSDVVSLVAQGDFDLAVGDLTVLLDRSLIVDFTLPFMPSGLSLATYQAPADTMWVATKPFTLPMWVTTVAAILLTALFLRPLEPLVFRARC